MSEISEFEPLLKEVVQAKRLSASKMQKLTELAMKCMQHDMQMVSTLYRTHKSLENPFKISSLYVFDALARAAKSKAVKLGLSSDVSHQTGNPATFLSKLGGVVEGLFRDMLSSDIPESKAKTKKVLDIWVKGSTFPPDQLAALANIVEGKEKEPATNGVPNVIRPPTPERLSPPSIPPVTSATPALPTTEPNPQAALLALLAQAANTTSLQTNVNTLAAPFGGIQQLAALQQLTASVDPAVPNVSLHTFTSAAAGTTPHSQGNSFTTGPNRSSRSPIPDDPRRPNRDDSRRERPLSPEAGRSHDYRSSDPRSHTKDPRMNRDPRTNPRGRGNWGEHGSDRKRWDDRDGFTRERDKGRSRSRSPSAGRFTEKRHERAFSPRSPSRRGDQPLSSWSSNNRPPPRTAGAAKDEFGRDARPDSPSSGQQPPPSTLSHSPPTATPSTAVPQPISTATNAVSNEQAHQPAPVAPTASLNTTQTKEGQLGMDSFDFSTFDLTSPASWEALGKMWEVTYGCPPRGDQLMQFVMSLSLGAMGMALPNVEVPAVQGQVQQQWGVGGGQDAGKQGYGMDGKGNGYATRGRGRGRGGFHGNNGRDAHRASNGHSSNWDTDAIVLGGGDDSEVQQQAMAVDPVVPPSTENQNGGAGGKMQKVGDKWVFVRNT